ncbi:MAG: ferritin-like domain-containing protein [Limisphaerales bacterium]
MKLELLEDLYIQELGDLLAAEEHMLRMMPEMVGAANNEQLRSALEEHAKETESQVERLKQILHKFDSSASVGKGEVAEALLEKVKLFQQAEAEADIREVALVLGSQKLEQYEIATYSGVLTLAKLLAFYKDASELNRSLQEERRMSDRLAALADSIEVEAVEAEQA